MLPNVDIFYFPAAQLKICPLVTRDIITNLLIPVAQIRFRLTEASRASVPKTAIDEHRKIQFRKIHIRASWDFSAQPISTYAHCPKIFSEGDLNGRVLPTNAGHQIASFFLGNSVHTCFPASRLLYLQRSGERLWLLKSKHFSHSLTLHQVFGCATVAL
jgi:hypothetical protein